MRAAAAGELRERAARAATHICESLADVTEAAGAGAPAASLGGAAAGAAGVAGASGEGEPQASAKHDASAA